MRLKTPTSYQATPVAAVMLDAANEALDEADKEITGLAFMGSEMPVAASPGVTSP